MVSGVYSNLISNVHYHFHSNLKKYKKLWHAFLSACAVHISFLLFLLKIFYNFDDELKIFGIVPRSFDLYTYSSFNLLDESFHHKQKDSKIEVIMLEGINFTIFSTIYFISPNVPLMKSSKSIKT